MADVELLPLPKGSCASDMCWDAEVYTANQMHAYARANMEPLLAEIEALRAERHALLDALRQIAEWPDGGNRYGQEKIKRFAKHIIDAALRERLGEGAAMI